MYKHEPRVISFGSASEKVLRERRRDSQWPARRRCWAKSVLSDLESHGNRAMAKTRHMDEGESHMSATGQMAGLRRVGIRTHNVSRVTARLRVVHSMLPDGRCRARIVFVAEILTSTV